MTYSLLMNIRTATNADWPTLEALNKVIDYNNPKAFHTKKGFSSIGTLAMDHGNEIFYKKNLT